MIQKRYQTLRAAIEELIEALEQAAEDGKEAAQTVELDGSIGRVTRVDALQQQKMAKANLAAASRRIGLLRAALEAIDSGDYGECVSCGEEIPIARLMAKPESQLCVECQEEQEGI